MTVAQSILLFVGYSTLTAGSFIFAWKCGYKQGHEEGMKYLRSAADKHFGKKLDYTSIKEEGLQNDKTFEKSSPTYLEGKMSMGIQIGVLVALIILWFVWGLYGKAED